MLNSFGFSLLLGVVFGTMASLGVGGGSLLVLWLTTVLHMPSQTARVINLLFFIPTAAISTLLRKRQTGLSLRPLLPAILSGCIAAIIFSRLSTVIEDAMLKRLFGILLVFTGMKELFYRARKAR